MPVIVLFTEKVIYGIVTEFCDNSALAQKLSILRMKLQLHLFPTIVQKLWKYLLEKIDADFCVGCI